MVSEHFGPMDTRFRNGVYEVLTRLESTIQIQKTLQAIRDELQSLLHSQIQLATYLPMLLDGIYESAEVFVDFDKPPVFDEDVFEKISYKSNSYFMDCFYESHTFPTVTTIHITSTTKTSPTRTTIPKPKFEWHIRSNKFEDPLNCGESNEIELPADLFGIYPCGQG